VGEEFAHAAVAQHGHVIDGVRARDHPGDQGGDFQPGMGACVRGTLNHVSARRRRPAFSASFITGTKPAEDTRLESSNDADTTRVVCETCIYEMPF
jgi:hypothetical protein